MIKILLRKEMLIKLPSIEFNNNPYTGIKVAASFGQTERQICMVKLIGVFLQLLFVNEPKKQAFK